MFHLPVLTTKPSTNAIPTLFVIQGDRHCMPNSDYYCTNIQPDPIVPVLDLTNSTITSEADLQTAFHSLNLCSTEKEHPSHGRKQFCTEEDTH